MEKPKIIKELLWKKSIKNKLIENIEYYELMSHSLGGQSFDCELVDHSRNLEAPFVKWIYKKIDAEQKLAKLNKEIDTIYVKFDSLIEKLNDSREMIIITYRYELDKSWESIGNELHFSESTIFRLHRSAITQLCKMEEKNELL